MAQQTVNVGGSANDGTGDPLRTAFEKINGNFDELYAAAGGGGGGDPLAVPAEWAPNFTDDGDAYIPATVAMTVDEGNATIGTGTIGFQKSTSAAPGTFSATSLPTSLETGAWLKVSATGVSGFVAAHLVRTA